MNKDIEFCDMCGEKIENGKCSCAIWQSKEDMEKCPIKKAIEKFHEMKQFIVSTDAPHLGCAAVFFRGSFNDCEKVRKFIYEINNRKYYK